jgi:hypothetical protein
VGGKSAGVKSCHRAAIPGRGEWHGQALQGDTIPDHAGRTGGEDPLVSPFPGGGGATLAKRRIFPNFILNIRIWTTMAELPYRLGVFIYFFYLSFRNILIFLYFYDKNIILNSWIDRRCLNGDHLSYHCNFGTKDVFSVIIK